MTNAVGIPKLLPIAVLLITKVDLMYTTCIDTKSSAFLSVSALLRALKILKLVKIIEVFYLFFVGFYNPNIKLQYFSLASWCTKLAWLC